MQNSIEKVSSVPNRKYKFTRYSITKHPAYCKRINDTTYDLINASLESELQSVLDNTFKAKDNEVHVGTTSDFLKTVIGIEDLKVLMPSEKAYASMVSKEQAQRENRFKPKLNYHNLGKQGLIDALNSAENPLFAYTPFDNRIVLVTDRVDPSGAPIVLIEDLESYGQISGKTIKANKDITVYGRNQISDDINNAVRENRILYATKKGSQMLSGLTRVQFPSNLDAIDFKNNIDDFLWKVNSKNGITLSSGDNNTKNAMQTAFKKAYEFERMRVYSFCGVKYTRSEPVSEFCGVKYTKSEPVSEFGSAHRGGR